MPRKITRPASPVVPTVQIDAVMTWIAIPETLPLSEIQRDEITARVKRYFNDGVEKYNEYAEKHELPEQLGRVM